MSFIKLKSFVEGMSSLRFLGIKNFIIIDINERYANVGLIKTADNPLKAIYSRQIPTYKIISSRLCEMNEDGYDLKRELKLLVEKNKIKSSVLILSVNKYKHFTITITKDDDDELSVEDLLRKQLPSNFNNKDFILDYQIISSEESTFNYLVTITRRQDLEKYLEYIPKEFAQLTFIIPFIFSFASENQGQDRIASLVDIQNERIIHYIADQQQKITEVEYFLNVEYSESDEESKSQLLHIIKTIVENQSPNLQEEASELPKYFIQTNLNQSMLLDKVMRQLNAESEFKLLYEHSQNYKFNMIISSLFRDNVFNFDYSKHFKQEKQFDVERAVTTKILIMSFSILLFLLLLLNGINFLTDNALSELAYQNQNIREIKLNIQKTAEKNEELKTDLKSLNKFKMKDESVSILLKTLSECSLTGMNLIDLKLNKNNSGYYEVKLNGESSSKDAVINYIRNLENNSNLSDIELIWLDKKKSGFNTVINSGNPFIFSINLLYNETKNS